MKKHNLKRVIVFICLSALLFGTMEVALKLAGNNLDAFQTTFLRFLIGGIVMLPVAIAERRKEEGRINIKDWLYLLLLGIVCVVFAMICFQLGVMSSNASTAAVLFSINPMFTVIFAHFMTKDDRFTKGKALSLLFGLAGIVMMIRPWEIQPGNTVMGVTYTLIAAFVFGLYSVMGSKSVKRIGTFTQTSVSFIFGALVLLIILLITGKPIMDGVQENIMLIMYLSVFVTGGGYLFYFLAIRHSDATTGSIVFFLKPVIAPIVAVIALKEVITWNMYIGIALILVASYIIIREKRKNAEEQTDFDILPE